MEQLEKFITDERTGFKYELCGDYYIIVGDDELKRESIGVWGQRHLRYIKNIVNPSTTKCSENTRFMIIFFNSIKMLKICSNF